MSNEPTFIVTGNIGTEGPRVGQVTHIHCHATFATPQAAEAYAAGLPKSWRVRGGSLSGVPVTDDHGNITGYRTVGTVSCQVSFGAACQGNTNEAGHVRVMRFLARVPYRIERGGAGNAASPDLIRRFLGLD
jgi:hypothetical protein